MTIETLEERDLFYTRNSDRSRKRAVIHIEAFKQMKQMKDERIYVFKIEFKKVKKCYKNKNFLENGTKK